MTFSAAVHEQVARDRAAAIRGDADAYRLTARQRRPFAQRLRCAAARFRLPAVAPEGCGCRPAAAGSS